MDRGNTIRGADNPFFSVAGIVSAGPTRSHCFTASEYLSAPAEPPSTSPKPDPITPGLRSAVPGMFPMIKDVIMRDIAGWRFAQRRPPQRAISSHPSCRIHEGDRRATGGARSRPTGSRRSRRAAPAGILGALVPEIGGGAQTTGSRSALGSGGTRHDRHDEGVR